MMDVPYYHRHQQYLLKSQQYSTLTLVMGLIVSGMIHVSTYTFNINSCSLINRGRVAGLLWPRSTSINISSTVTRGRVSGKNWPTSTTSTVTWVRVAGLLIPMSTTFMNYLVTWGRVAGINRPMPINFLSQVHSNTFFFVNSGIVVTTAVGRMDGLTRPRS